MQLYHLSEMLISNLHVCPSLFLLYKHQVNSLIHMEAFYGGKLFFLKSPEQIQ